MTLPLRKLAVLLLACALVLVATACGGGNSQKTSADVPANAIALVGDQQVSKDAFNSLMSRAEKGYKQQGRKFPKVGTQEYQDLKGRVVTFLVQRYEYRAEAQKLGVTVSDAEVQKRLDEIKQQSFGGSQKKLDAELAKIGLTQTEAKEEIRDRLIQEGIFKKVTSDVKVTDAQVQQYYDKNKAQFTQPRKVRHILVKQKALADKIYKQLQGGADFAKLAKKYSTDPSGKKGGVYTAAAGQTVQPFYNVAIGLKTNEISKPVKTQYGWHVIQALEPVKTTPLSSVKASIKQQLLQQKQNAAMNSWLKQVKSKYASQVVYAAGYKPTASSQSSQ